MSDRPLNWPLWTGLALSVVALFSYGLFFYRFPITRDVPWLSYLLFAVAFVLLIAGVRRAFAGGIGRRIVAIVVAVVGVGLAVLFVFGVTVGSRVPTSAGAPAVGAKAPDFTLLDTNRKPVALSQLLATPDPSAAVIRRYDILHKGAGVGGHDVARPAELIVDSNGIVRWRNLTEDLRVRARPEAMVAAAKALP